MTTPVAIPDLIWRLARKPPGHGGPGIPGRDKPLAGTRARGASHRRQSQETPRRPTQPTDRPITPSTITRRPSPRCAAAVEAKHSGPAPQTQRPGPRPSNSGPPHPFGISQFPETHQIPFSGNLTRFPGACNRGRPWAGLDHSAKGEPRSFPTQHAHQTEAPNPRHPDLWDSIHQRQGTGTVLQGHVPKVILNKLARKIGIKNIFCAKPSCRGFAPKPRFRLILTKSCTKTQGWLTNRSDA